MRTSLFPLLCAVPLIAPVVACGGHSDATETATGALEAAPAASKPGAPPVPGPTVLASCKGVTDPTTTSKVTVDPHFKVSWTLGPTSQAGTLLGVTHTHKGPNTYSVASTIGIGLEIRVDEKMLIASAFDGDCDPASFTFDQAALDRLIAATGASEARSQTFASCGHDAAPAGHVFTVRPDLAGTGALIEGTDAAGDDPFALAVTRVVTSGDKVDYVGEGVLTIFGAGQHPFAFTTITTTGTSLHTDRKDDADEPLVGPDDRCTFEGADFAKSLVTPHS